MSDIIKIKGGAGSGHHGHSGRPGMVGGSQPQSYMSEIPRNDAERQLLRGLNMMDDMRQNNMPKDYQGKHVSLEGVVMEYGSFQTAPKIGEAIPEDCTMGKMRECFYNSLNNTVLGLHGDKYIYTEGYATTELIPFPVAHAWLTTKEGKVIDVTWEPGQGIAYMGIRFNDRYAGETVIRTETAGLLINDWMDESRILRHGLPSEALYD